MSCWPWSTLRDLAGAVVDPWTQPARVAKAVGRREGRLLESVTSRDGVTPPLPCVPTHVMVASVDAVAAARTIQNLRRDPDRVSLAAARLCLADPRLRIHDARAAASFAFGSVRPPYAG